MPTGLAPQMNLLLPHLTKAIELGRAFSLLKVRYKAVLAALDPSDPPLETKMDANEFHNICGHASESLLRATAKPLGVELTGEMHACIGCSMSEAF